MSVYLVHSCKIIIVIFIIILKFVNKIFKLTEAAVWWFVMWFYNLTSSCHGCVSIVNQQRLKTDEYEDVETFSRDMCLLFDNAVKFYQSDLQEHKDAVKLQEVFADAKARLCTQMDEQGTFYTCIVYNTSALLGIPSLTVSSIEFWTATLYVY